MAEELSAHVEMQCPLNKHLEKKALPDCLVTENRIVVTKQNTQKAFRMLSTLQVTT